MYERHLNGCVNKFADVACIDQTRVILKPWPNAEGDFIHANWVTDDLLGKKFICTQVIALFTLFLHYSAMLISVSRKTKSAQNPREDILEEG